MPTLIDRNGRVHDLWIRPAGSPADTPQGARVLLPLAQWQAERELWNARVAAVGVLLGPADDPAAVAGQLDEIGLIAVEFPTFSDGRGFSIGRLLRERYGWRGELRAVGEVLRDPLFYLARCGFDTFALVDGLDPDAVLGAFGDFSETYQAGTDRPPLFARRAAAGAST